MATATFVAYTREDTHEIAAFITDLAPGTSGGFRLALCELLLNAIEHGTLEIGGSLKSRLLRDGALADEIAARRERSPFRDRKVTVELALDAVNVTVWIRDEGPGFDWHQVASSAVPTNTPNGRGLMLVKMLEGISVDFNEKGNEVVLRSSW